MREQVGIQHFAIFLDRSPSTSSLEIRLVLPTIHLSTYLSWVCFIFASQRKKEIKRTIGNLSSVWPIVHRAHQYQLLPMGSKSTHPQLSEQPGIYYHSSSPREVCPSSPCSCSVDEAVSNLIHPTKHSAGYLHVKQRSRTQSSRPCSQVSDWQHGRLSLIP